MEQRCNTVSRPPKVEAHEYEAPQLQLVGEVAQVVLGLPGGGPDGYFGMSDWVFEFESDARN
jgi:hypothetical protein